MAGQISDSNLRKKSCLSIDFCGSELVLTAKLGDSETFEVFEEISDRLLTRTWRILEEAKENHNPTHVNYSKLQNRKTTLFIKCISYSVYNL